MTLEIVEIGEFGSHKLRAENGQVFVFCLEFDGLESAPKVGDRIEMNQKLLDEKQDGFCKFMAFGKVTSQFGRKIGSFSDPDCILLTTGGKEIFLKRLFG